MGFINKMEETDQLDGLFMTAMQKSQGIENFFDGIFGFLLRKSDFFSNKESSKGIIEKAYGKYLTKHHDAKAKEAEDKKKKELLKTQEEANKGGNAVKEITKEQFEKEKMEEQLREKMAQNPELQNKINEVNAKDATPKKEEKEEDKLAEGKIRPNKGNGANLDKYL